MNLNISVAGWPENGCHSTTAITGTGDEESAKLGSRRRRRSRSVSLGVVGSEARRHSSEDSRYDADGTIGNH